MAPWLARDLAPKRVGQDHPCFTPVVARTDKLCGKLCGFSGSPASPASRHCCHVIKPLFTGRNNGNPDFGPSPRVPTLATEPHGLCHPAHAAQVQNRKSLTMLSSRPAQRGSATSTWSSQQVHSVIGPVKTCWAVLLKIPNIPEAQPQAKRVACKYTMVT